jgi:transposase InsO family protein
MKGYSLATYYNKQKLVREVLRDPAVPKAEKWVRIATLLAGKPRPGRLGHDYFSNPREEVRWQFPWLYSAYQDQAKPSVRAAWEDLLGEIKKRRATWGMDKDYPEPTLAMCHTALKKIPLPELVLGREGPKAFEDKCGKYLSRDPNTLRANDLWVTDQRQVDVRVRDGGEHPGRLWMVAFMDVATEKILGYAFAPVLSSDPVMMAATMAIERFGVPRAVLIDLGKEFICKAFNGSTHKFSGEVLYRVMQGLWNSLGVKVLKAIGHNAKTKPIERLWREITRQFDKRFPGYTASNTDERPEKLADEERQHLDWLAGKSVRTPLVTMGQYIQAFIRWAENDWNGDARGRGKMRRGMSPNECWNVKKPTEGFRTISLDELDFHSAEHRFVKVARGGQVNLTFFGQMLEYEAERLFNLQGEEVEVIVSRRTFRKVVVIYPIAGGTASCEAWLKPQLAWVPENRDELRAAMRCKAAVHRAVRQGLKANRAAFEAANPVELLQRQKALPAKEIIGAQKFFADTGLDHAETGSVEYLATRRRRNPTAEEVAENMLRLMKEAS